VLNGEERLHRAETRLSSSESQCEFFFFLTLYVKFAFSILMIVILQQEGSRSVSIVCDRCLSTIGRGLPHVCTKKSRHENIAKRLTQRDKEQVASGVVKDLLGDKRRSPAASVSLTTGGRPLHVSISPAPSTSKPSPGILFIKHAKSN
jgi:hypothetical protein